MSHLPFGGQAFEEFLMGCHTLFLGAPGSGKSALMHAFQYRALVRYGKLAARAVVVDDDASAIPRLLGMGIPEDAIWNMNPLDAECVAWDASQEVRTTSQAATVAGALVPKPKGDNGEFWYLSTRQILKGIMLTLSEHYGPGNWNLNSVVEIAGGELSALRKFLRRSHEGRKMLGRFIDCEDARTSSNVLTNLGTQVDDLEPAARLFSRSTTKKSLLEWRTSKKIIVLGSDTENEEALLAINRALFVRLVAHVQAMPNFEDGDGVPTYFFLDEIRDFAAGGLPGFRRLLGLSRKKGAHAVLCVHCINGLMDALGEYAAREILGLCENWAMLKILDGATLKLVQEFLGNFEEIVYTEGGSTSSQGGSRSWQSSIQTTPAVLTQEFINFPKAGPKERGGSGFVPGIFYSPARPEGPWRCYIPWEAVAQHLPAHANRPGVIARPDSDQNRVPFTFEEQPERPRLRRLRSLTHLAEGEGG